MKASGERDFTVLWIGQTFSVFGSAISFLALPTVAILVLHATPFQLGVLEALAFAAFPVLGLVVGVIADRTARRRIMIVADALRFAALGSVPIAAAAHALTFAQLAVVALFTGIGSVFFDISYQSYLPSLVSKSELVRSNARLEFTRSLAELSGNGIAGILISMLGAATAVAIDAASFAVSIASLLAIRMRETVRRADDSDSAMRRTFVSDLRAGLDTVLRSPVLRTIAGCTATGNFGGAMLSAVLLIYAYRDLHVSPVALGLVLAFSNVGFVGAAVATRSSERFGLGKTLAGSTLFGGIGPLLVPLASHGWPLFVLFVARFVQAVGAPIYNINQVSLRQSIVEGDLQGRMNATMRTIVWGTMPLGALTGGALGTYVGVVPTIFISGTITAASCLWILCGPAIRLRSIASAMTAAGSAAAN